MERKEEKKAHFKGVFSSFLKSHFIFLALFVLWCALSYTGAVSAFFLPTPTAVILEFWSMLKSGEWGASLLTSLSRVISGFALAFVFAFLFSSFRLFFKKGYEWFKALEAFLRSIPPLSLLPLFILLFGIGEASKILVIVLSSFFALFINFSESFEGVDKDVVDEAEVLGFKKTALLFKIYIPYSYSGLLSGIKVGLSYAWRSLLGAEMFSSFRGLGFIIRDAELLHSSSRMAVGILTIAVLGLLFDKLFSFILKKSLQTS